MSCESAVGLHRLLSQAHGTVFARTHGTLFGMTALIQLIFLWHRRRQMLATFLPIPVSLMNSWFPFLKDIDSVDTSSIIYIKIPDSKPNAVCYLLVLLFSIASGIYTQSFD